jgi:hypothetical protein
MDLIMNERDKYYFLQTNISELQPKVTENDIAICCPICKEGKSWNRKQRLHFYYDNYLGKCLVYVGAFGIMPQKIKGEPAHEKLELESVA